MTRFATITERSSDLEKTRILENETLRLKGNESLKKERKKSKVSPFNIFATKMLKFFLPRRN